MQKVFQTQEGMKGVVTYEHKMTPREFVESCINGCQIIHDKDNNRVIFAKDGKWYFELKKCDSRWVLWCSHTRVWKFLVDQHHMVYNDIQALIAEVMKDTYNMGSVTSSWIQWFQRLWIKQTYNMGSVTPKPALARGELYETDLQ